MYIGELDSAAKKQWYRHALATLFPVRWAEPFGMVLIESMACGTPVVAFRQGAVPEVVQHARTGFVVDSTEEMIRAIGQIDHLDRTHAREHVCRAFSLEVMATRYAELYDELAEAAVSVGVQPARRVEFAPVPAAVLTPG